MPSVRWWVLLLPSRPSSSAVAAGLPAEMAARTESISFQSTACPGLNGGFFCGEAAFSEFHFIRTFKNAYGFTPHAYLSWLRIARAKELLEQGVPVSEACYAVGFESITSFARLFKKHVTSSPSAYRRERLELAIDIAERPRDHVPTCFAASMGWN